MNPMSGSFRCNRIPGTVAASLVLGFGAWGAAAAVTRAADAGDNPARVRLACATVRQEQGQESSDAPGGESKRGRFYEGEGSFDFGRAYGRGVRPDQRSPRPHEWEETQAFMQRFAPRRFVALEQMPEGESKEQMKRFWFARFRSLQALQKRDVAAYEQRLSQLRVEDQIFGIVSDWSPRADPSGQQLRENLRGQVTQLVDLDLQERQRRVEWLKRELAEQSEQLDRDLKQRDNLVDQRVTRFADWAGRWARRRAEAEKRAAAATTPDAPGDKKDAPKEPTPAPDAKKGE
jgi:hypothetical protein